MKLRQFIAGLRYVYNVKDERGRGRFCMLLSAVMAGLVGQLSGGLFYTSFLLQYGMDKSRIGILTFVPYLACLFSILSPWVLEHFKKRKWLLVAGKFTANLINIVGITVLPTIVTDPTARLVWFVVLIITASCINQLFASGFSAWNANFLPDNVRVDYFTTSSCINSAITFAVTLAFSYIGDLFTGTEQELMILTMIRYIAFALAVIDCLIWLVPKEYPYATTAKANLFSIFTLPFKNKRFLGTIMLVAAYTFVSNLPNATLNAYVLDDVGISYTLCNGINATYFLFFIFFSNMWKRFISKHYWFRAFGFVLVLQALTYFAYSFVTADTVWLYVVVRFTQHVMGVVVNTIIASLPYVNLPDEDRTNYLSFHTILTNFAAFISLMIGTGMTAIMGESRIYVLNLPFSCTQVMLFACAVGQVLLALHAIRSHKKLTPPEILANPHT